MRETHKVWPPRETPSHPFSKFDGISTESGFDAERPHPPYAEIRRASRRRRAPRRGGTPACPRKSRPTAASPPPSPSPRGPSPVFFLSFSTLFLSDPFFGRDTTFGRARERLGDSRILRQNPLGNSSRDRSRASREVVLARTLGSTVFCDWRAPRVGEFAGPIPTFPVARLERVQRAVKGRLSEPSGTLDTKPNGLCFFSSRGVDVRSRSRLADACRKTSDRVDRARTRRCENAQTLFIK